MGQVTYRASDIFPDAAVSAFKRTTQSAPEIMLAIRQEIDRAIAQERTFDAFARKIAQMLAASDRKASGGGA